MTKRPPPFFRLLVSVVVGVWWLGAIGGCFSSSVPATTAIDCRRGEDCPEGLDCLLDTGICITSDVVCVERRGRDVTRQADGNACGDGVICVAGSCVAPRCGDGVISAGEVCDDGPENNDTAPGACRSTCQPATCGDGTIDDGEECDDGPANSDTAEDACRTTCRLAFCGDGIVDDSEGCDSGAANSDTAPDACRLDCRPARCGDGIRDLDESCDDGILNNDEEANACRTTCQRAQCGDDVIDDGEVCDGDPLPVGLDIDACRSDCVAMRCGDGRVDPENGEVCDDANNNPRDGCDGCRRQQWQREILVSGSQEGRDPLGIGLFVTAVTVDATGRLFVGSDTAVHRLDPDGTLNRIAGIDEAGFSGDGGPATSARLRSTGALAVDSLGRLFIADTGNHRIRRVDVDGTIHTVAGTGSGGFGGDGGPAVDAQLNLPEDLAFDRAGRLLVVDLLNQRIRRIDVDGTISTIAGTGAPGFAGDGGPAVEARLSNPRGIGIDGSGRVLVADTSNHRIRRIEDDGRIVTIAGSGAFSFSGDDGPATSAGLQSPTAVVVDREGRVVIAERNRVRRIEADDRITTIAGTGASGSDGDGGPATAAQVQNPQRLALDATGRVVIAAFLKVRRLEPDGTITTIAGTGSLDAGDGGPATLARLTPVDTAVDAEGRLLIIDAGGGRIRRIDANNAIETVLGDPLVDDDAGLLLDGVTLNSPSALALDPAGRLAWPTPSAIGCSGSRPTAASWWRQASGASALAGTGVPPSTRG